MRETCCLRLRVLQGGCTVITSPEDLGEESFHEERTSEAAEADALQAPPCFFSSSSSSYWKQNLNANISSANRLGTQETLAQVHLLSIFFFFLPSAFCLLAMK